MCVCFCVYFTIQKSPTLLFCFRDETTFTVRTVKGYMSPAPSLYINNLNICTCQGIWIFTCLLQVITNTFKLAMKGQSKSIMARFTQLDFPSSPTKCFMSHIFFLAEINLFRNDCYQPCVDSSYFLDYLPHSALLNVTHIDQITERNYIEFFEITRSRATFVKQLPFGASTCKVDTFCPFKHHKKCLMIRILYPIAVVMHGKSN